MGVVCEARHLELGGRRFAVKLVQRYFAGSDIAMARFRREVRAVAAVESDHIVQVTDVGVDEKFGLYMVMEFLQGEDLSTYLHRMAQIKPIEAVKIAHQIARGLAKAHAARIIHRDLKPGNIFLTRREDGSLCVKIYDFGISKLVGDPEKTGTWNAELTGVGMPVGTPQYMSPEQAHGVTDLDARSDVWSLGAVLFEMLAGRGPYPPRGRAHHTIMRVMTEPPPLLETVAPWVPAQVAQVVNAALERDRDRRIPDCNAFADMLERRDADGVRRRRRGPAARGRRGHRRGPAPLERSAPGDDERSAPLLEAAAADARAADVDHALAAAAQRPAR
jgi:serine/threonine-protein kinase